MESNIEKLKEQIKKLKGQIENMKNIDGNLSKRVEQNINVTGNLEEMLTAKSICDRLDIKPHVLGKIMKGLMSKHEGQIQKGYSKIAKRDRQITFFGLTLNNNSMANLKTSVASNPAPIVLKAEIPKPVELTPKPAELTQKPAEQVSKPIEQPSKSRSVDIIKEIPEEKLQLLTGCTSFDGFLGTFPKGFSVTVSKKKELLAVNNYLIRNKNGTMSVLEDPPHYIQDYWDKALLGEI